MLPFSFRSLSPLAVDALDQVNQNSDNDFNIVDSHEKNFLSLPGEVILHIFSLMDLISLGRCAQVCTLFREVIMNYDVRLSELLIHGLEMHNNIHDITKVTRPISGDQRPDVIHSGMPQVPLPSSQLAMSPRPCRQGQVLSLPRPLMGRKLRKDQVIE